jgi:hypothetical protein
MLAMAAFGQYLARVVGNVPAEPVMVDQPIRCKSHREAVHEIHPEVPALLSTSFPLSLYVGQYHSIRCRKVNRMNCADPVAIFKTLHS